MVQVKYYKFKQPQACFLNVLDLGSQDSALPAPALLCFDRQDRDGGLELLTLSYVEERIALWLEFNERTTHLRFDGSVQGDHERAVQLPDARISLTNDPRQPLLPRYI